MVDHIYGRTNMLNERSRKNMFLNELEMYVDYLKNNAQKISDEMGSKKDKYLESYKNNLKEGIKYYHSLAEKMLKKEEVQGFLSTLQSLLNRIQQSEVSFV